MPIFCDINSLSGRNQQIKNRFYFTLEKQLILNKLFTGQKNHAIRDCKKIIGFTCRPCIA